MDKEDIDSVQTFFNISHRAVECATEALSDIGTYSDIGKIIDQDEIEDLMRLGMTLSSMIDRLHHDFAEAVLKAQEGVS